MDPDSRTRAAIEEHWRASEGGDTEAEHAIYAEDAILDYPQSGERFRSRATIAAQRGGHPAGRHFTVLRIAGSGNLWVSECIITYDGVPSYSVSIMELAHEDVVHETQYFADTFRAPAWRTALAEPMPGRNIATALSLARTGPVPSSHGRRRTPTTSRTPGDGADIRGTCIVWTKYVPESKATGPTA
jgi:hypothetical protein